jgi:hypothetical protein
MIGPYWMAFINAIVFSLVLLGFFLYRYYFPQRKINFLLLLGIVSLLPCISIFRIGVYESGDFTQHIYRAMVFYDALKEGIPIPSWAASLNGGYGYPVFIFIYLVPYYLISLLHFLGFNYVLSTKLLLALAFMSSGFIMYVVLRKLTKSNFAAFTGSVIYLFTPYHLVDLHFRVAIAEILAFVLAPLIFYLLLKIEESKKIIYVLWMGLLFGIFFLTHPAQFIFYTVLFFIYIMYQTLFSKKKKVKLFFTVMAAFSIGLIVSSFAWIPRFTLTKFTHGSMLMNTPVSYVQPLELLFSPWRAGFLFQGHKGELSFLIGYTQIFILLFCLFHLFKHKKTLHIYKKLYFWTIAAFTMIFLMLPYSQFIWHLFPLLNLMQFSYRFLHPLIFCLAIITAYLTLIYKNKKNIVCILIILTIGYTMLNWGNRRTIPTIGDNSLKQNIVNSTREEEGMIEANPLWWDPKNSTWIPQNAKRNIEVLHGNSEIKEIKRTSTYHSYIVYSPTSSELLENTFYFPNWTISIDSHPTKINFKSKQYPARMIFTVPAGLHHVEVQYSDIPVLQYSKILSLLTIVIILIYTIFYWLQFYSKLYKDKFSPKQK